jgi:glycogen debranching enzyme
LSDQLVQIHLTLEADDGMAVMLNITPRLAYNRSIPSPDRVIEASRATWDAWFDSAPPVAEQYRQQYYYAWWVMRVGLLATRYYFTREALVPSKVHYVGVWHWDQFFHALAYRHVDAKLAEDQIRIILDHQQANGMLPDAIHDEGLVTHLTQPVDSDVTKPPLLAWTALKLYEKSGHLDFLQEVYEPIVHWHNWWLSYSANECGLCEYRHPFSSGLDDSPLWDAGMPVISPDLNTYLYIHCRSIARIAELIGEQDTADMYRGSAEDFAQGMLKTLWNPARGIFDAYHDGQPVPALTPFNLMPLWVDTMPAEITERLLAHLTDPATFWPDWPIPSVALTDPSFNPAQMWRGPTWPNINYLFVEALTHIGRRDIARKLRQKTLELIMQQPDIYEYYNPITAERPLKAAPVFGWSSAVFIDLAIQESAAVSAGI